jgi:hypothetical protein
VKIICGIDWWVEKLAVAALVCVRGRMERLVHIANEMDHKLQCFGVGPFGVLAFSFELLTEEADAGCDAVVVFAALRKVALLVLQREVD